jgi:hypothetical protein
LTPILQNYFVLLAIGWVLNVDKGQLFYERAGFTPRSESF